MSAPFIQVIECRTSRQDEMAAAVDELERKVGDRSTVRRSIRTQDRDDPNHVMVIVFFDSYESAMENSTLPETDEFATTMMSLVDGPPTFHNLEVVDDRTQ
jgi:quinol monooxygenase YgiN